jgi:hypothetical protein
MGTETNSKEQVVCNSCNHRTWHSIVFSQSFAISAYDGYGGDDYLGDVDTRWDLLQCMGCGSVSVRMIIENENDEHPYVEFYPERTISHHFGKYYVHLPKNLAHLYSEISATYNRGNLILCSAGLRALLEGICVDKGIYEGPDEKGKSTKSLEGKINGLASIVPPGIVKNLHRLRFLGNQALHELDVPDKNDVKLAISVIEDIMNIIYDLDYRAQLLLKKTANKSNKKAAKNNPA